MPGQYGSYLVSRTSTTLTIHYVPLEDPFPPSGPPTTYHGLGDAATVLSSQLNPTPSIGGFDFTYENLDPNTAYPIGRATGWETAEVVLLEEWTETTLPPPDTPPCGDGVGPYVDDVGSTTVTIHLRGGSVSGGVCNTTGWFVYVDGSPYPCHENLLPNGTDLVIGTGEGGATWDNPALTGGQQYEISCVWWSDGCDPTAVLTPESPVVFLVTAGSGYDCPDGTSSAMICRDDTAVTDPFTPVTVSVLANDSGQAPLSVTGVTQPSHGEASVTGGQTTVLYTPDGTEGVFSFVYTAADGLGRTDAATVTITVQDLAPRTTDCEDVLPVHACPTDPAGLLDSILEEDAVRIRHRLLRHQLACGERPYATGADLPRALPNPDPVDFATGYDVSSADNLAADQVNVKVAADAAGTDLAYFDYNDLLTIDEQWEGTCGQTPWMRRATAFLDTDQPETESASRSSSLTFRGAAKLLMQTPFVGDLRADKVHMKGVPGQHAGRIKLTCVNTSANAQSEPYYRLVHGALDNHTFLWADRPYPRLYIGDTRRALNVRDGSGQVVFSDGEVLIEREWWATKESEGGAGGKFYQDTKEPYVTADYYRYALPQDEMPVVVTAIDTQNQEISLFLPDAVYTASGKPVETWPGSSFTVTSVKTGNDNPGTLARRWKIREARDLGNNIRAIKVMADKYGHLPFDVLSNGRTRLQAGDGGIVVDANMPQRRILEVLLDGGFQASQEHDPQAMTGLFHIDTLEAPVVRLKNTGGTVTTGGGYVNESFAFHKDWGVVAYQIGDFYYVWRLEAWVDVFVYRASGDGDLSVTVTATLGARASSYHPLIQMNFGGRVQLSGSLLGGATVDGHEEEKLVSNGYSFTHTHGVPFGAYDLTVRFLTDDFSDPDPYTVTLDLSEDAIHVSEPVMQGTTDSPLTVPSSDDFVFREIDKVNHQEVLERIQKYMPPTYQYWTDEYGSFHVANVRMTDGGLVLGHKQKVTVTRSDAELKTRTVYRVRDPDLRNVATVNAGAKILFNTTDTYHDTSLIQQTNLVVNSHEVSPPEDPANDPKWLERLGHALMDGNFKSGVKWRDEFNPENRHLPDNMWLFEIQLRESIQLGQLTVRGGPNMTEKDGNCRIRIEGSNDDPRLISSDNAFWEELIPEFEFTEKAKDMAVFTSKDFGEEVRVQRLRFWVIEWAYSNNATHRPILIDFRSVSVWPVDIVEGTATLGVTEGFTRPEDIARARRLNVGKPRTMVVEPIDEAGYQLAKLLYPNEPSRTTTGPDGSPVVTPGRRIALQKYADGQAANYLTEISQDFLPATIEGMRPDLRVRQTVFVRQDEVQLTGTDPRGVPLLVREVSHDHLGNMTAKAVAYRGVAWSNDTSKTVPTAPTTTTIVWDIHPLTVTMPYGATSVLVSPAPRLMARHPNGTLDTGFTGTAAVRLKPTAGPYGAALSGTAGLTGSFVDGRCRFEGLSVDKLGANYILQALVRATGETEDRTPLDSASFDVIPPGYDELLFTRSPGPGTLGFDAASVALSDVALEVLTPAGERDATFSGTIDVTIQPGTGHANATLSSAAGTSVDERTVRMTVTGGQVAFSGTGALLLGRMGGTAALATATYVLQGTTTGTWENGPQDINLVALSQPFTIHASTAGTGNPIVTGDHRAAYGFGLNVSLRSPVPFRPADGAPLVVDLSPWLDGQRSVFPLPPGIEAAGDVVLLFNGVQAPPGSFSVLGNTLTVKGLDPPVTTTVTKTAVANGFSAGTDHEYAVTALGVRGLGAGADGWVETSPGMPTRFSGGSGNGFRIAWTEVPGAAGYRLYRNGAFLAQVGAFETAFLDHAGRTVDTDRTPPSRNLGVWLGVNPAGQAGQPHETLVALVPYRYAGATANTSHCGVLYHPKYKYNANPALAENMPDGIVDHTPHFPDPTAADYSSTVWHDGELSDMEAAGVDWCLAVLPLIPQDYTNTTAYGTMGSRYADPTPFGWDPVTALTALATATNSRTAPPGLALCYDTAAMEGCDLALSTHRAWVMDGLFRFYDAVEPALWAMHDGRPVLMLGPCVAPGGGGFLEALSTAFETRYGVAPYLLASGWGQDQGADADPGRYRGQGAFPSRKAVTVGPGYNDAEGLLSETTPVRDRENGNVFLFGWQSALNARPEIVLVDSWNDLFRGTAICRSAEDDDAYIRLNAAHAAMLRAGDVPGVTVRPAQPPAARTTGWGTAAITDNAVAGRPGLLDAQDGVRLLAWPPSCGSASGAVAPSAMDGIRAGDLSLLAAYPAGIRRAPLPEEPGGSLEGILLFDVADAYRYAIDAGADLPPGSLAVEVLYWDDRIDATRPLPFLWLEYDAWGDGLDHGAVHRRLEPAVRLAGTSAWKYARWDLPADAYLGNRQGEGGDLCLRTWPAPVWLRLVRVFVPTP